VLELYEFLPPISRQVDGLLNLLGACPRHFAQERAGIGIVVGNAFIA
jgi:hypothetical protein